MSATLSARVSELNLLLPPASPPAANYAPSLVQDGLLYISGQIGRIEGQPLQTGRLGDEVSTTQGIEAARQAALGVLAQIASATGDRLDRVARVVKLTVFVAAAPGFDQQSQVANGASDLMTAVFGEAGRHVRSAVGVASLPAGAAVEVEAIVALAQG
ncbi:RidA family protein [Chromobacterium alticapitis]|uniref:Uncharacterized protein n=1 Tax=Chromobacterium alticapitis TaxID=2073169 RepID=A0A2S5DBQ6_9NEIS|nr:RidA family protein [Chromobacterium alticapitis]POZ60464.1 hypothetical protein C2I19_18450 [Chromobacterium alticapitis]